MCVHVRVCVCVPGVVVDDGVGWFDELVQHTVSTAVHQRHTRDL